MHFNLCCASTMISHKKTSLVWNFFTPVNKGSARCGLCGEICPTRKGTTTYLHKHLKIEHSSESGFIQLSETTRKKDENRVLQTREHHLDKLNLLADQSEEPSTSEPTEVLEFNYSDYEDESDDTELVASSSNEVPAREDNEAQFVESENAAEERDLPSTSTEQLEQPPSPQQAGNSPQVKNPVKAHRTLVVDTQLVRMIVKECQSSQLTEEPEFKEFVKLLSSWYTLPFQKWLLSEFIPEMLHTVKEKVATDLDAVSAVCLSANNWTSIWNDSFIGITAHYINKQSKLCSNFLNTITLQKQHTAKDLAYSLLKETIHEWRLGDKVVAVVSDRNANITSAINICGWQHIPCFASSINFIVQVALQGIEPIIQKVRNICEFFKSPEASAKFHQVQEQMKLPSRELIQDDCTRWISTCDMISLLLFNREAVISTLCLLNSSSNTVTPSEWKLLQITKEMLDVFKEMITEIDSQKSVGISKLFLFVRAANRHLDKYIDDDSLDEESRNQIGTLKLQILTQYQSLKDNDLVCQATLLDPRFKEYGFKSDEKFQATYNIIQGKLAEMSGSESELGQSNAKRRRTTANSLWEDFDSKVNQAFDKNKSTTTDALELDKYLQEPLIGRLQDPLVWWQEKKKTYPRLYELVLTRLCIVATAIPGELLHTPAGQMWSDNRSRLSATKVSQTLFLSNNFE